MTGHRYGTDFVYDEMVVVPGLGDLGRAAAEALAKVNPFKGGGPQPGEGPSREERESGHYDLLFAGLMPDGTRMDAVVTGDRDPGYGSTSKMIAETARLLAETEGAGGIWTPGALLGGRLRDRLQERAGLSFTAG